MRLNILIEDSKLGEVRESWGDKDILKIPVSPNGEKPTTHWFCSITGDEPKITAIYNKKNLSTMELEIGPKEFLNKWGLKLIK